MTSNIVYRGSEDTSKYLRILLRTIATLHTSRNPVAMGKKEVAGLKHSPAGLIGRCRLSCLFRTPETVHCRRSRSGNETLTRPTVAQTRPEVTTDSGGCKLCRVKSFDRDRSTSTCIGRAEQPTSCRESETFLTSELCAKICRVNTLFLVPRAWHHVPLLPDEVIRTRFKKRVKGF